MNKKDCEHIEQLLSRRLDEELTSSQESEIAAHIADCQTCRDFETALAGQRQILRMLPDVAVPDEWSSTINEVRWWRRRLSLPLPVAAVFALVAIGGWLIALNARSDNPVQVSDAPTLVHSIETVQVPAVTAVRVENDNDKSNDDKEDVL